MTWTIQEFNTAEFEFLESVTLTGFSSLASSRLKVTAIVPMMRNLSSNTVATMTRGKTIHLIKSPKPVNGEAAHRDALGCRC